MDINIELYCENGVYGAYLGSDGGSGIDVKGNTPQELSQNLAPYLADIIACAFEEN